MTELKAWLEDALKNYHFHRENKICIVSIIGKAPLAETWTKGALINELIDRQAFERCSSKQSKIIHGCKIETFFDTENQCVFLNLQSPFELNTRNFDENSQAYHEWWVKQDVEFASNVLFLFSISQIVLFTHPTCRFDLSYIRLFRTLNSIRENTLAKVHDLLIDGSYRKLASCLEDQIYKLLRKSRVITNNTTGSICSLPQKQSFCYIFAPNEEPKDISQILLNLMSRQQNTMMEADKRSEFEENGFKRFFFDHLDSALIDGFDDNVGKVGPAYFELPKFKAFVRAASILFDFFVVKRSECWELQELDVVFDVITKFSENRCTKVYPIALASYQDGLPSFYSEIQHRAKFLQAVQVLQQQARGPSLEKVVAQLAKDCEEFWRNGRRSCEIYSLTGNICLNRLHRLSAKDLENEEMPIMWHHNSVKFLSTCNCGRRQAWRPDPFDLSEANFTFYEQNEEFTCCHRLQRYEFPVYRRTRKSVQLTSQLENTGVKSKEFHSLKKEAEKVAEEHMGQKIQLDEFFGRINIGVTTQDDFSAKGAQVSADDFLLDRDNRPSSKSQQRDSPLNLEFPPLSNQKMKNLSKNLPKLEKNHPFGHSAENLPTVGRLGNAALNKTQETEPIKSLPNQAQESFHSGGTGSEISDLLRNELPTYEQSLSQEELDLEAMLEEEFNAVDSKKFHEKIDETHQETNDDAQAEFFDTKSYQEDEPKRSTDYEEDFLEDELGAENSIFLSGMIHNQCPLGLLPLFPSWSLVCLGHSSLYSHSSGLRDQPNFSHGSQFLLPWDVTLPAVDLEKWHSVMEAMTQFSKRPTTYKKPRLPLNKKRGSVSVKVFICFEYECPRGHRFTMQAPDKILKHPGPGGPKDNGGAVTMNDMPLWFPCSCSSPQRQVQTISLGQLTRVHIITPKAPVLVLLNPRVQPQANGPIFTPGFCQNPVKLAPAQYWVLRLPFCYHAGPQGGPLYPPKDRRHAMGRMLRSSVGVVPDL